MSKFNNDLDYKQQQIFDSRTFEELQEMLISAENLLASPELEPALRNAFVKVKEKLQLQVQKRLNEMFKDGIEGNYVH